MATEKKIGVLLLNLGGPDTLDDVEPFLYNLFSDRQIIRLGPAFLQKPIAKMIAWRRAPKSKENYDKIGGGSPILRITNQQARALEKTLADSGSFLVRACMRYWFPRASEALQEMISAGVSEIIALPLYPHYSIATTGSSFTDLEAIAKKMHLSMPIHKITSWPQESAYIECIAQRIQDGLKQFDGQPVEIVYSAHSLPKKFIDEGDPYVRDLELTIQALEKHTGIPGTICYQSRSGPVEWLAPSTPDMLRKLAGQGSKNILMIPLSFVSDHVETLYEINMLFRDLATELGMRLESISGLNDDPVFIKALKDLVLKTVS